MNFRTCCNVPGSAVSPSRIVEVSIRLPVDWMCTLPNNPLLSTLRSYCSLRLALPCNSITLNPKKRETPRDNPPPDVHSNRLWASARLPIKAKPMSWKTNGRLDPKKLIHLDMICHQQTQMVSDNDPMAKQLVQNETDKWRKMIGNVKYHRR